MSAVLGLPLTELERRGFDYGAELAAALALAGNRADGDRTLVNAMAKIAVREIMTAVEWLRGGGLPEEIVEDYERACRKGFRDELLRLTGRIHVDTPSGTGRIAA